MGMNCCGRGNLSTGFHFQYFFTSQSPLTIINKNNMLEIFYAQWIELKNQGVGVHCGECGCYNKTPHNVFIPWFADVLDILSSNGIGFALWNFKGSVGILDCGREDVDYEDWYGHKLDRRLLDIMLKA